MLYLYLMYLNGTSGATTALVPWSLNGTSDATAALVSWSGGGEEEEFGVGRTFGEASISDFLLGVFVREATRKVGSFAVLNNLNE